MDKETETEIEEGDRRGETRNMSNEVSTGSHSSFILAEGKRRSPFGFWWLLAAGIVGVLVIAILLLIGALHRPLLVPEGDSISFTAPPKALGELPASLQESFPESIQEIIETKSSWPVTFGLYRNNEQWEWYVIGPAWLIENEYRTNGLISMYKSSENEDDGEKIFRYTQALSTLLPFKDSFAIEIEPQLLVDASGLDIVIENHPIRGRLRNGLVLLDVPFESETESQPLNTADLALTIPKNGITEDAIKDFIRRLSNGRHHHLNIPELAQYHVWLDDLGRPTLAVYTFETPLSVENAAQLLGAYGFYSRQAALLPDGTLSYEHIAPTTTDEAELFGDHVNEQGEMITLRRQELLVRSAKESPIGFEAVPICEHKPWIRLSSKSLGFVLGSIGSNHIPENLPNIQIGSMQGRLSICFE